MYRQFQWKGNGIPPQHLSGRQYRSEFFYGVEINGKAETRMMAFRDGTWTAPVAILVHDSYCYNDPFLSPDEKKLFFISDRPLSGSGPKKDNDIWYIERRADGWSEPIC